MSSDVIIVPGGGVREGGVVPPWVARRLDRALAHQTREPILLLSGGTTHKPPPLDERGFPIFEAVAGARYLLDAGADPEKILLETASWDTVGNAYFARTMHTDPAGYRRVLVITSEFHLQRTERIFRWIFRLDAPARAYDLTFEGVSDEDIESHALDARREHEARGLARIPSLEARLHTLAQVHRWLFTEHNAYAAGRLCRPSENTHVLETY